MARVFRLMAVAAGGHLPVGRCVRADGGDRQHRRRRDRRVRRRASRRDGRRQEHGHQRRPRGRRPTAAAATVRTALQPGTL